MYFNFFLNDDKGFPFYGVTLTYADSAVLNLAQLATWAEFKEGAESAEVKGDHLKTNSFR